MNKNTIILIVLALSIVLVAGCNVDIYKTAKVLYTGIKTIVTDDQVRPMIPDDTMSRLALAEKGYLKAVRLRELEGESHTALEMLVACAGEILEVLDTLDLGPEYERPIGTIRVGVKTLRNIIQLE